MSGSKDKDVKTKQVHYLEILTWGGGGSNITLGLTVIGYEL